MAIFVLMVFIYQRRGEKKKKREIFVGSEENYGNSKPWHLWPQEGECNLFP